MVKMIVRVKYPLISNVIPYKLSEFFSISTRQSRIDTIHNNFQNIKRWTDARRNYSS